MLTPAFEISQDSVFITIIIKAPYAKVSDAEIFIEDDEFRFFSKPYFLRLSLPGCLVEDGRESAQYNSDDGSFTVRVPKAVEGQVFEGLDMITKLLTPKGQTTAASPLIQVLDSSDGNPETDGVGLEIDEDFDWHVDQKVYVEEEIALDSPKYGFANTRSGVFKRLQEDICDVVSLPNPDGCGLTERHDRRTQAEDDKFDPDYYLADYYEDDMIQQLVKYTAPWETQIQSSDEDKFTDEEKEKLRNLPKKEYLIEDKQLMSVYLGLVDILFAYAYNHRTTEGEDNVESAWTICNLSATLSWLDVFYSLEEVIISSYRRSLCYPLYRQWNLSTKALQDVQQILKLGRHGVLKCLLEVHTIFSDSYPRYILNNLYITDYCVWIQNSSDKRMTSLADAIAKVPIQKDMVGFSLLAIERESQEENDSNIDTITESVSQIKLHNAKDTDSGNKDSDDDSTETESNETTETDDESTSSDEEIPHSGDAKIQAAGDKNTEVIAECSNMTNDDDIEKNCITEGHKKSRKSDDDIQENRNGSQTIKPS